MRHLNQCPPAHNHRQRSRTPVTKSQLLSLQRQKPRGTLRPRAPREQCPVQPRRQGPVKTSIEGAPTEKVNRFGTISDMDVDSISGYLSDERKSHSKNTSSFEHPLPLPQSQSPSWSYPPSQFRSPSWGSRLSNTEDLNYA